MARMIHSFGESGSPLVTTISTANRACETTRKGLRNLRNFGWLSSRIQVYPDTLLLKARVHSRSVGVAPSIELEPTDHPLAVEQRIGIGLDRVREISELLQH